MPSSHTWRLTWVGVACSRSIRGGINAKCDGHHRLAVRHVTALAETTRHTSTMVNQRNMEAAMLLRSFARLTSATIVVTVVLLFAVPFVFALIAPFIAR